MYSLLPMFPLN